MEPDTKNDQEEEKKTKEKLFKEMEEKLSEKYRLKEKKKSKTIMRFKEKETNNVSEVNAPKEKVESTEADDDEVSDLKKLVLDLTTQVKSLKIQNEHMMDDEYKHKSKNKKRVKTINKIGALKLLLTNLKAEMKDNDAESEVNSMKHQLDHLESK